MQIIRQVAKIILVAVLISSIGQAQALRLTAPAQPVPEAYFGMHIHGVDVPRPYSRRVTPWPELPIGAWRLMDAYVTWDDLEPNKNEFNFARLDRYVAIARQKHVKVLLPLYSSPAWASARPMEIERDVPPGSAAGPANMNDWRAFVRAVATRYKGQIEAYEIWNEPNLNTFWTGSVEQLVDLSREAFQIIKSVDPAAMVVLPACTAENGLPYLDNFLKKGGGLYGDVIGYHFYVNPKEPEAIVDLANRVKEVLRANHVDKPVWNTESGWAVPKPFPSDQLAAGYVARALTLAWAAGISRFYWYSWDNHGWVTLEMVETDDVTQRPAAKAYTVTEKWLLGAFMNSCESDSADDWTCELQHDGKRQWIVWNTSGAARFSIPANWRARYVTTLFAARERLRSTSLQIGPIPLLLEH